MNGAPSMRSGLTLGLALCLLSAAVAAFVLSSEGRLEYDDATYLTRGLFHAAQVQDRGNLLLPRLAWSLTFESPKPPLFHGLLATAVLAFGRQHIGAVLVTGTVVPLLALAAAIILLAGRVGGANAGILALAAYLAMRSTLELGTRLYTETTLAATVIGGVYFAYRRARGGGVADEVGLGICAGLSLLAKLLGPLFLGPAALVALAACWRREGPLRTLRFAAVSAVVAAVVAAPWYLRNWRDAVEFGTYARSHPISLYLQPAWRRPLDFVGGGLGWPMAAVVTLLAVGRVLWRPPTPDSGRALLRAMTVAVAVVSGAVVATQPVFDPRFWLPAQALIACWVGIEASDVWQAASTGRRGWTVTAAVVLVAHAVHGVATAPRPQTPWHAGDVLARITPAKNPPALLCTLGDNPDWNLYKLRLAAELSGLRPRPEAIDLLVHGRAIDFERRLASCDAVFALAADQVPQTPNQQAFNADLAMGWRLLGLHAGEFRQAPRAADDLGSRAKPELLVRLLPPAT